MSKLEHGYTVEPHVHVEGDARHLDAALLRLDLGKELEELERGLSGRTGHQAKTLAKYPDLRLVLIAFQAGARLEQHQTKGRISIQTVRGHVLLNVGAERVDLPLGCLLQIAPNMAHDVQAVEQSAILVTIAWPTADAT